jgi:hypothetical protein
LYHEIWRKTAKIKLARVPVDSLAAVSPIFIFNNPRNVSKGGLEMLTYIQ